MLINPWIRLLILDVTEVLEIVHSSGKKKIIVCTSAVP